MFILLSLSSNKRNKIFRFCLLKYDLDEDIVNNNNRTMGVSQGGAKLARGVNDFRLVEF